MGEKTSSALISRLSLMVCIMVASILFFTCGVFAVPAFDREISLVQPDGESFPARMVGDEYGNWMEAENGDVIVQDEADHYWKIGRLDSIRTHVEPGTTICEKGLMSGKTVRNSDVRRFLMERRIERKQADLASSTSISVGGAAAPSLALNLSLKPQILVLLVEFSDVKMKNSETAWSDSFFSVTGSSVNAYYKEVSKGAFWFEPATENWGAANDGVVRVTLGYNHPRTGGTIDYRNQQIVSDALSAADPYVNFAVYDANNNGIIETNELNIVTVVAGYEQACGGPAPSVWAHSWTIASSNRYDRKSIAKYTQQGETQWDHMATIGVLCHELGHNLGLPDLYDYGYDSAGVGVHSLMAGGSWGTGPKDPGDSPTHLDAFCKALLGFAVPIAVDAKNPANASYQVNSTGNGADYNIYRLNTPRSGEYFLFENRQFSGFDIALKNAGVKSGGIAIWHIDESIANNDNVLRKKVDLEEANEGYLGKSELDSNITPYANYDHYYHAGLVTEDPNLVNNTFFQATGRPGSNLYSGAVSGVYAEILSVSGQTMNVTFTSPTPVVVQKPPTLKSGNTAWTPADIMVTITDSNSNSGIRYKIGSTGVWAPYSGPLTIGTNGTVYAKSVNNSTTIESSESTLVIGNIDKLPPSAPSSLSSASARSSITVKWRASADTISGIQSYEFYVNGVKTATLAGTALQYTATGLAASTSYTMMIKAVDKAGNISAGTSIKASTTRR